MADKGQPRLVHGLTEGELEHLKREVVEAKTRAYCPYSKFPVGCTILLKDGSTPASRAGSTTISGANIENAAYPNGACAERTAINSAVFLGLRVGDVRAISVTTDMKEMCSPCGSCRQVIREFCELTTPIFMYNVEGDYVVKTVEELLPMSFGPSSLGVDPSIER